MNGFVCKRLAHSAASGVRSHQFVVCGGGAGGLAVASSLARRFGKEKVAVIEPSDVSHSDLMNNNKCISKNYDNYYENNVDDRYIIISQCGRWLEPVLRRWSNRDVQWPMSCHGMLPGIRLQ